MVREAGEKTVQAYRERVKFKFRAAHMNQLIHIAILCHPPVRRVTRDVSRLLFPRELQVLGFLGEGISTQELARRLCISRKTVQGLCTRIKGKVGVSDFHELVRVAALWREGRLVLRKQYEWRYGLREPTA
jgi:DNA-binding CsgD family transcriptional regulator